MKGGILLMTKVIVQNGNVDGALKKFKAKVARSGVPSELKKRKNKCETLKNIIIIIKKRNKT